MITHARLPGRSKTARQCLYQNQAEGTGSRNIDSSVALLSQAILYQIDSISVTGTKIIRLCTSQAILPSLSAVCHHLSSIINQTAACVTNEGLSPASQPSHSPVTPLPTLRSVQWSAPCPAPLPEEKAPPEPLQVPVPFPALPARPTSHCSAGTATFPQPIPARPRPGPVQPEPARRPRAALIPPKA